MLSRLKEYADEQLAEQFQLPPLYEQTPVAHIVLLTTDGQPVSAHPIARTDDSTTRGRRGRDMPAPVVQRSVGIKPLLLADNGEYTFGRARDPAKQGRTDRAHRAYLDLLGRCGRETEEPSVVAVERFFAAGGVDLLELDEAWDHGMKVTFEVLMEDGSRRRPIELPTVQRFWLTENLPDGDSVDQCLVCGERRPVLERLQGKIRGIRGGQSSGTSIISANSDAFESYGLEASRTAPTCRECGEGFTRAINSLIAGENTHLYVGDTTFIFWTKSAGFDLATFLRDPDPQEVRALLQSVVNTRRQDALIDETAFHAAALSGSGARAVVRDWIDTTVGNARQHIARWFQLQSITDPRDEDPEGRNPRPLGLFPLAAATVRTPQDLPVTTPRHLFRSALQGTPLPLEIVAQAVRRNQAEKRVTRPRAALGKLVLLSRETQPVKEDYMVALETEHPSPAYHCGRLLAVIEQVQRAALPGVNATIVDRFYGAASSTPGVVFGTLLRGAQPHLSRLKRDNRGAHERLQRDLEEVIARIGGWPATLTLQEQALFSLGYYHQRAHDRSQLISRRNARDASNEDEPENEE